MRARAYLVPVVLAGMLSLACAGGPELGDPARAALLKGVDSIPKFGAPGPVAIFGERAFAVIAGGAAGRPRMALCAAAELGKGRIVAFGHNGYLDGKNIDEGHRRLMLNAVGWCANGRKAQVGIRSCRAEALLSGGEAETVRLDGALTDRELRGIDVLILNAQGMTNVAEAAALETYVRTGGGLIAGATGWAFGQTSGGGVLNDDLAINRVLAQAGLAFTAMTLDQPGDRFSADAQRVPLLNAQLALRAFAKSVESPLSAEEFDQASSAIGVALSAQPAGGTAFIDAVRAALGAIPAAVPSQKEPLLAANAVAERARLALEVRLAQVVDPGVVRAHPAAATFPGAVPALAPRVKWEIGIDPKSWGWHSTGLYAAPGEKVIVTVPRQVAGAGFSVRIGCHTDELYKLDVWRRAPGLSRSIRIREQVTWAANAFGGLLYIEVPEHAVQRERFTAVIQGAVPAPHFVLDKDDDARWNSDIKKRPGPWAEFACDRVILTCPSEVARRVSNPGELMRFWVKVLDAQAELAGIPAERRRPERIVADVQISNGYMHSGYPIMVPLGEAAKMVTRTGKQAPGWGFYHELGHNHQRPEWTFEGTGEVTCNLFSLWSFHRALGESDPTVGHEAMSAERRQQRMKRHLAGGAPFEAWKKDPFLALTLYWQLIEAFGWDALKRVIASYGDGAFGPPPKSDDEKRDQWMVRYSKLVGRNLGPFFDRWGVPVSASAKASVEGLESWMPASM